MKIVWTGAAGFIAGYAIEELLNHDHEVIGIDNYSKYGKVEKAMIRIRTIRSLKVMPRM